MGEDGAKLDLEEGRLISEIHVDGDLQDFEEDGAKFWVKERVSSVSIV